MSADAPLSWGLAEAAAAGTIAPIAWVEVEVPEDDLVITVPKGALAMPFPQADGRVMRSPVSYKEQIQVARSLGCVGATITWAKAIWRAAPKKLTPVELVITAADAMQMGTLEWLLRSEDAIDAQVASWGPDDWGRGACKGWYIDPMMEEQGDATGACNWGFVHPEKGPDHPDQNPGGRHVWTHLDYSQKEEDLPQRTGRRLSTGEPVDLLLWQCAKFSALAPRLMREYGP